MWRGVDVLEEMLTGSDRYGYEQEMELVDEVVFHQCGIQWAGAVFKDVSAGLLLQLGDVFGDVAGDDAGFQVVCRRVVDATCLGMLFIRSTNSCGTPSAPVIPR
jgi:hypothetical protein